jgi:predicted MFS family arabinose efflux permease
MAAIRDTSSKEFAASRIGYVAMTAAIAPLVGPTIGGSIDQWFGWRVIFWLLAVAGGVLFIWCFFRLSETNQSSKQTFREQVKVYVSVLAVPLFWSYSLCLAFSVGTFYALMAGAPLAAKETYDIQPVTLGMYMGSITAGYMLGSFLSGRYAKIHSSTAMILVGRVTALIGPIVALALLGLGLNHPLAMFGPCVFIGIGNGLTSPSANAGVMSVRAGLTGSTAGLAGAVTVAGGAIFSSITAAAVTERNAIIVTLYIMLATTLCAFLAGCWARFLDEQQKKRHES